MTEEQQKEQIIDRFNNEYISYSNEARRMGLNIDGQGLLNSWLIKKLAAQEVEIIKLKTVNPCK